MPVLNHISPVAIGLVAVSVLLAGCGNRNADMQAYPPPQVVVVTLKSQPITLTRELPGRTSAFLVAEVRPQVGGIIKRRLFVEGAQVKAGEVLYEIDDSVYRAAHNSALANLNKAKATLEAARLNAQRSAELVKVDAVSIQDNDNVQAGLHQAEADVAANQAALESAKLNLDYARITAPITGRIGKSSVTAGALVTANQTAALATVQQLDPVYVDVTQSSSEWLSLKKEIDAGRVQSGGKDARVQIILEDGSSYAQQGKMQFADVTVDETTGSFLLRALVPNSSGVLMPGMYVRAMINEGTLNAAILVPQQAVTRTPTGDASSLVVESDGKVALRTIKVARTLGDQWLVAEGLNAGDRVIVEGVQKVQPGMMAQASERAEAPAAAQSSTSALSSGPVKGATTGK